MLLLIVLSVFVKAGEPLSPEDITNTFFTTLIKGDISGSYEFLFRGSSIPIDKPQAVVLLKQQTQNALSLYGKILGYEFIKEEKFGSAIVRRLYVLKSEKGPIIWEFHFYKPKESWFLINVAFNDEYNLLR